MSNPKAIIVITVVMLFVLGLALTRSSPSQHWILSESPESPLIGYWGMVWSIELFSIMLSVLIVQMGMLKWMLHIAEIGGGILAPP